MDSAHHFAGLVSTNTKCAIFAAVCIHADRLPREEPLMPELADNLFDYPSDACILNNHKGETDYRLKTIVIINLEAS